MNNATKTRKARKQLFTITHNNRFFFNHRSPEFAPYTHVLASLITGELAGWFSSAELALDTRNECGFAEDFQAIEIDAKPNRKAYSAWLKADKEFQKIEKEIEESGDEQALQVLYSLDQEMEDRSQVISFMRSEGLLN
jgi:hypothetical protein